METKQIQIKNLGKGTHIFGAAYVHPKGDTAVAPVCACPIIELGPKGSPKESATLTPEQFRFYDDENMRAKVDSREFAILVDGHDLRPDLAKREAAKLSKSPAPATESDANKESSVLAEILAEGEPKAE